MMRQENIQYTARGKDTIKTFLLTPIFMPPLSSLSPVPMSLCIWHYTNVVVIIIVINIIISTVT